MGSDNWNAVDVQTVSVTITTRTYTVTFDANGGEGTMEPFLLTCGGDWTALPANTFTRSGYGFNGWNTEADGSGTAYSDEDLVRNLTDEADGNVVLYAQWGEDIASCEIRGTLEAYDDGYGPYNQLAANVEVWDGDTQLTLDTDYTIELDPNIDIYSYVVGEQYQATVKGTGDWSGTKAFTFTFVALHHTVVFVANGGSGTMASGTVANDGGNAGRYTLPVCGFTAPDGKVFDHWVVDYAGIEENPIKQPGDYFTAPYIYNVSDVQTITVTAYWRDALILLNDDSAQPAGSKNADIIAANNGKTDQTVQLSGRTLYKDGSWNTLCLPFDLVLDGSPLDGATAKTLTSASLAEGTLTLNFGDDVTTLTAGTPYIIKWESGDNIVNPVFTGVTIEKSNNDFTSTDGKVTFKGTYEKLSFASDNRDILFMGATNTLYYPQTGASIGAQRTYFQVNTNIEQGDDEYDVRAFVLNFGEEETGISDTVSSDHTDKAGAWYDLNGRRLSGKPARRGVYVSNGKKVVIK